MEINGKEFKVNLDIKWGTEKLIAIVMKDPSHPKAEQYMTAVFKDLLIPSPTVKEMFNFRRSDIQRIFEAFTEEMKGENKDFKKKRSQ